MRADLRRTGGPGGREAGHEPAVHACSLDGQQYPGLHLKRGHQQGKGGDSALVTQYWNTVSRPGALSTRWMQSSWNGSREEGHKESWSTSLKRKV